jgi:long-chain acyl-CoA synthetase
VNVTKAYFLNLWFCRVVEEYFLVVGGSIGYWRGDIKYLLEDIAALKPTMFCGVPRVFDRIYAGVHSKASHRVVCTKFPCHSV